MDVFSTYVFSTDMFNNHDQEEDLSVTFSNAYSY